MDSGPTFRLKRNLRDTPRAPPDRKGKLVLYVLLGWERWV